MKTQVGTVFLCVLILMSGLNCSYLRQLRMQPKIQTELVFAAIDRNKEKVKELVKSGANPNGYYSNNIYENTFIDSKIFDVVIKEKNVEMINLFIDLGADVNLPNKQNVSPLMLTTSNYSPEVVQILLSRGAEVNFEERDGTALDIAEDTILSYNDKIYQSQEKYQKDYDCAVSQSEKIRQILIDAGGKMSREHKIGKPMPVPVCSKN